MSIAIKPVLIAPKPFKKALAAYQRGDLAKTEVHCLATLKIKPDFFIGAHAPVAQLPLLTRDPSRYRRYFSGIALITPDDTEST